MPPLIQTWPEFDQKQWIDMVEKELEFYHNTYEHAALITAANRGLDKKQARQAARSLLPNCGETIILCTANAKAW